MEPSSVARLYVADYILQSDPWQCLEQAVFTPASISKRRSSMLFMDGPLNLLQSMAALDP